MTGLEIYALWKQEFSEGNSTPIVDIVEFARAVEVQARKEAAQRCAEICKLWEERYVEKQFMDNAAAAEQCAGSISEEFGL